MCKTIKQTVSFKAPPTEVYKLLAEEAEQRALTGVEARFEAKAGGAFSAFSGAIEGINVELVPGKRLVQAWREKHFPEGIFSMATFNLSPTPSGGTKLILTHRGVPKDLIPKIEDDWRQLYWNRIKQHLKHREQDA